MNRQQHRSEVLPDVLLIGLLRAGDEAAFVSLVHHYTSAMMRLAMVYVTAQAEAEEVVQETWIGVLEGVGRFEGRSSLKTWVFRILTNRAKTRAQREGRSIPFSSLLDCDIDDGESAFAPDSYVPANHQWPGSRVQFPPAWEQTPEERLLSQEMIACVQQVIAALPSGQREVITLRDIEGWTSGETCDALGISGVNQRVLLHRARSKVRSALEKYFEEE